MRKLVLKTDHDVEITDIVEQVIITYPIEAGDGELFEYTGGDSESYWDTAEPIIRQGQRVFQDRDGNEYLESEIEVIDD